MNINFKKIERETQNFFFFAFERQERGRKTQRQNSPISCHLLTCEMPTKAGLGPAQNQQPRPSLWVAGQWSLKPSLLLCKVHNKKMLGAGAWATDGTKLLWRGVWTFQWTVNLVLQFHFYFTLSLSFWSVLILMGNSGLESLALSCAVWRSCSPSSCTLSSDLFLSACGPKMSHGLQLSH